MRGEFGYSEEKELGRPYDVKLLRRLFPFARPYTLLLIGSIFLVILMTLLELSVPYITKIAIDQYIVPTTGGEKRDGNTSDKTGDARKKTRYYQVDLSDPQTAAVVSKYPRRFEIHAGAARIPFEELSALASEDLSSLRRRDLTGVSLIAGLLLCLILMNLGINFFQIMLMEFMGQQIMHDIRMRLFIHIQHLAIAFFTRHPVGRLVTRVTNDVQNMHELFTSVIVVVFKDFFLLIGIAVVLLGIDWKLAMVSFTVLPFVLYVSFRFSNLARDAFRVLRIKIAEINTRLSETISGIEVIQLFRLEMNNFKRFKKLNHETYLAGILQIQVFAVFMPVIELLGSVAIAVVIFYGGRGVIEESISLGALVAFISYMKMFFRPIRDIAEKYNIMQNAMASAERLFLILDENEELSESPVSGSLRDNSKAPAIHSVCDLEMAHVSFGYIQGEPVIKDICFRVQAGESIALVGPTGSGKTSLINLIPRFYDPDSGQVRINGHDVQDYDIFDLRSKMALVMQEPFLFSETIRENIVQGNQEISEKDLQQIVEASNCGFLIDRLPNGLDTVLSEGGGSISSGERQLISIARAFARNPELILLDEATSYIDSETEQKVQSALVNLMKNRTSVIIAHRLSTARFADTILVLNRGKLIERGSHEALMAQRGFYFRLNQLQNGTRM